MSCIQSGGPEPSEDVLVGHLSERIRDRVVELPLEPGRHPAEDLLDLREHLLDRRIVRAVRVPPRLLLKYPLRTALPVPTF